MWIFWIAETSNDLFSFELARGLFLYEGLIERSSSVCAPLGTSGLCVGPRRAAMAAMYCTLALHGPGNR